MAAVTAVRIRSGYITRLFGGDGETVASFELKNAETNVLVSCAPFTLTMGGASGKWALPRPKRRWIAGCA
jgi:hypothetical protein